jgi:hypothetical protein
MKYQLLSAAVIGATLSLPGMAAHHETEMKANPVELYACSFREGKTWDDLDKVDKAFVKWSEENDLGESIWRIVPDYRSGGGDFEVGYIGAWASGAAMAESVKKVDAEGYDAFMEDYYETIDCSHALAASWEIHATEDPAERGTVWFSRCNLEDGATMKDAMMAHGTMSKTMGTGASSWLFTPALGWVGADYDYLHVSGMSLDQLGAGFDKYFNGGGWQAGQEAFDGVAECQSPNLYRFKTLYLTPPAE